MQILFALGSNGSGQLGIGHKEDVSVPKQVLPLDDDDDDAEPVVKTIAAGGNHTLLLTTAGKLYWAGDPSTSACGNVKVTTTAQDTARFRPVNLASIITTTAQASSDYARDYVVDLIAATWEASIITTHQNTRVYTFGAGLKGELGLGPFLFRTPSPSLIPNFPPPDSFVVGLAASMSHVVAVLSDGSAWGWGAARKGQLGVAATASEDDQSIIHAPRRIEDVAFKVVRAVCGREFTCLLGPSDGGEMAVLGSDKWGIKSKAPKSGEITGWKDVAAGWSNVFVLKADGTVVSWGKDDHGQLAPAALPPAAQIAVGSEHALALSDEGDVIAWGWGEHGNCGPAGGVNGNGNQNRKGNIIASSKYIPSGAKITAIGAGCATSFVAIEMPPPT